MDASFEKQKNIKAVALTLSAHALLFLLFFFIAFHIPVPPAPMPQEGFEVNLGNSETGEGETAPAAMNAPAPDASEAANPVSSSSAAEANIESSETDDDVSIPPKKIITLQNKKAVVTPEKKSTSISTTPAAVQQKPAPAPKALYKGGNGTGGNDADSYQNTRNQGIAGGNGDQGKPNGNINSNNYTRNSIGGNGMSISGGVTGRQRINTPSFRDEFNENANIAVDIKIDADGNVVSAAYRQLGSTSSNANLKRIAIQSAKKIKFNKGTEEGKGVLVFKFRLQE